VQPTKLFLKTLRSRAPDFEVSVDWHTGALVNPLLDISKFISNDRSDFNYANYQDRVLDELFDKMNRATDPAEQRRLMRQFEKRALDEQAHMLVTQWWYRIIPHRSIVRGTTSPRTSRTCGWRNKLCRILSMGYAP
jgi:peptide/nickel transport system substrate-binding protein